MKIKWLQRPQSLSQATLQDILDSRDPSFLKHDIRTDALSVSTILNCYCNTVVLSTKSSHYEEATHPSYKKKFTQYVFFEDFHTIASDRDIPLSEAIKYALFSGDIQYYCDCPAFLYWGYQYIATQLETIYKPHYENRFPDIRNPQLRGCLCKHADKALQTLLSSQDILNRMFTKYYEELTPEDDLHGVSPDDKINKLLKPSEDDPDVYEVALPEVTDLEDVSIQPPSVEKYASDDNPSEDTPPAKPTPKPASEPTSEPIPDPTPEVTQPKEPNPPEPSEDLSDSNLIEDVPEVSLEEVSTDIPEVISDEPSEDDPEDDEDNLLEDV